MTRFLVGDDRGPRSQYQFCAAGAAREPDRSRGRLIGQDHHRLRLLIFAGTQAARCRSWR